VRLFLTLSFAAALTLAGTTLTRASPSPSFKLTAVGDMAMAASSDGGASFFSGARGQLRGDIVLGNLEGTLANGGSSKCGAASSNCFAFRAPPAYARVLKDAGFTVLNLANNHALDFGPSGQAETVAALDHAGLRHTGRPGEGAFVRIGKIKVAIVGFAPYPWANDLRDIARAVQLVRKANEQADVVLVTMHAGAEGSAYQHVRPGVETYLGENRGNAVAFAHAVVNAGADVVVGHGPHVLRAMEWYRSRLIAYSLGNFLGNGTLSISGPGGVSAVLQVRLHRDGSWAGGRIAPMRLVSPGIPRPDPSKSALSVVRALSREDLGPRAMRVSVAGTLVPRRS
jgi:Bacterial capsule synthesis protein PGA_cap